MTAHDEARKVLADAWEEVVEGPDTKETWTGPTVWVCKACHRHKPTHRSDCPYLALAAMLADNARLRGLLKRLREWDMMSAHQEDDGMWVDNSADGHYWRDEIDKALAATQLKEGE